MPNVQQSTALTEEQWGILLSRISKQKCTPFLGAEAVGGLMPRSEIARDIYLKMYWHVVTLINWCLHLFLRVGKGQLMTEQC